jgi:ubiquinone/menaquinone biosynthesis C-methylase UbiE
VIGKVLLAGAGALGAYVVGAYVYDVVLRPYMAAQYALREAHRRGTPLLNVGAGTRESSLRCALFGPTTWGDVNLDLAARNRRHGPGSVSYGDVLRIPFPDRHFGAAIASHVLEHVERPDLALQELHRVADVVVIVAPKWWAPHTWLHPGHRWYIRDDGRLLPLWGWSR